MARIHRRTVPTKGLNDLDNHDDVAIRLEPNILAYEAKWALGSIMTKKANGGDRIPDRLFKILNMMRLKCCD